jgi:hypothetical protein
VNVQQIVIGIIGTAGRKEDASRLNPEFYQRMKGAVLGIIAQYASQPMVFVSGGAAVADHLAVQLFLTFEGAALRLHLPADYDLSTRLFVEAPGQYDNGRTANYYHRQFSARCQVQSQNELASAIQGVPGPNGLVRKAEITVSSGFKSRNLKVAADAQVMIALTFGQGAILKDGGTAHTMGRFLARKSGASYHVDCNTMRVFSPAVCQPT